MKKILISLFFVLSFFDNFGQTVAPQGTPTTLTNNRGGYRIDSVLFIPERDTASLWFGLGGNLSIYNGKLYFNDGNKWVSSGTGGGGDADSAVFATLYRLDTLTASLYDSLTATLRIRDSLLSYVTPTQLSDSIQANKYDTTYLYSVLGNKINYSDTGTMLLPYLRKSDTASLSSRINGKLSISDTSTMLSPYLRKVDTFSLSSRINAKLNISDTANKWLPIGTNIPDSSTYLTNYRSDTIKGNLRSEIGGKETAFSKGSIIQGSNVTITGTLTNRLVGSGDITISASGTVGTNWGSIGGTLSDQTDLNNALGAKLNISDTGTMLSPYLQEIDTTGKWLAASTYIPDSSTFATLYRVDTAKSNIRGEIGGKEPTFSKGSIIQGTGVSISGTLTNRLVGSGNITISATGSAGYVQWSDSVAGQLPTTYRIDTIKTNIRNEISNIPIPDSTGLSGFFTNYGADTLTASVYDSFVTKENKGKIHPFVEVSIATGASTAAKVGTTTGGSYTPQIGDIILLNFNTSNTASNPSVNIDGSGAISIRLGNSAPSNIAVQGTKVLVWYDGTYYQLFGSQRIIDSNTTYSEIPEANIINSSSSATGLITGRRANYLLTQRSLLQTDSTVTYVTPTQLNTGLNNKLNISDTSTMLSPYFRTVDTTGKWLAANTYIPDSSTFATNYKVDTVKNNIRGEIPEQFNPIAGTNISLSGSYPNITFNASGGGGVTELVDLDDVDITTGAGVDGYSVVWDNGTGKFVLDDISGGGGGGATWGAITGTLSDQTDLDIELNNKVPSLRTITINGTTQDLSANRTFTVVGQDYFGSASTTDTPDPPTGDGYWTVIEEGVYTNFDNVELLSGKIGVITRISGTYTIYQEDFTFDDYLALREQGMMNYYYVASTILLGYYDTLGNFVSNGNYRTSDIVQVNEDDIINLMVDAQSPTAILAPVIFWDEDMNVLGRINATGDNGIEYRIFNLPVGTKYMAISQPNAAQSTRPLYINIKGSKGQYWEDLPFISGNSAQLEANTYFEVAKNFTRKENTVNAANYGVLFWGQSNILGTLPADSLANYGFPTSLSKSKRYNTSSEIYQDFSQVFGTWGIYYPYALMLEDSVSDSARITIFGVGNSSLYNPAQWNPASTNMSSFGNMMIKDLREQVTAHPNINYKYVISIQGEADAAVNPHINAIAYYQNMKNFIAWVRGALDLPQLKWIIVGMHKDQNYYNQHIRNAQVKIAEEDPFTYFINPDSLTWIPLPDNLHYTGQYMINLRNLIWETAKTID